MKKLARHRGILEIINDFNWRHKYTILILLSIFLAYFILTSHINDLVVQLGILGYIGSFVAGFFFALTITAVPATASLFVLSENLNPLIVAVVGSLGSIVSNYILLKFFERIMMKEFRYISKELKISTKIFVTKSKFFRKIIPFVAGFFLITPLPDEIGIAIMGSMKFDIKKFMYYSFVLHFAGILVIASASKVL